MIKRFAEEIAKREPAGIRRMAAMYACVRLAHQRAREEPERKFWAKYMADLERKADELKRERELREMDLDPIAKRRIAASWRKKSGGLA